MADLFATIAVVVVITVGIFIYAGHKKGHTSIAGQKQGTETSDYFNKYYIKGGNMRKLGFSRKLLGIIKKPLPQSRTIQVSGYAKPQ